MSPTAVSLEPALLQLRRPSPMRRTSSLLTKSWMGKRVELPPMSIYAVVIATELSRKLGNHGEAQNLGRAVTDGLFRLPLARDRNRNRQPDVAFVSYARWPRERPLPLTVNAWDVVPDLAVEVISPTDGFEEVLGKVAGNPPIEAGVSQVWLLIPVLRLVYVHESLTRVRLLAADDELDGGALLPGFHTAVARPIP